MSKTKTKKRKNETLKEKVASEVSAKKAHFRNDDSTALSRQASRMMKEKYIRELKDHSKDKGGEKSQTTGRYNRTHDPPRPGIRQEEGQNRQAGHAHSPSG